MILKVLIVWTIEKRNCKIFQQNISDDDVAITYRVIPLNCDKYADA
jgi:hypothetical protein